MEIVADAGIQLCVWVTSAQVISGPFLSHFGCNIYDVFGLTRVIWDPYFFFRSDSVFEFLPVFTFFAASDLELHCLLRPVCPKT